MSSNTITCEEIARALGGGKEVKKGPSSYNTLCPAHHDSTPSLSVKERNGKILVHCHAGCSQAAVIEALRSLDLWPKKQRVWIAKPNAPKGTPLPVDPRHPKLGKPVASWVYRNRQGLVAGIISRFVMLNDDGKPVLDSEGNPKKEIIPLSWCYSDEGEMRWNWRQMPEPRCLYGEDKLTSSKLNEQKPILIVEGEKTADKGQEIVGDAFLVITWPGGSKAVRKANWEQLKGREVVIWPDNDAPGQKAARELAEILLSIGVTSVRKVTLPENLPEGWDLADPIPDDMQVLKMLQKAEVYTPAGDSVIEKFNAKYATVMVGGHIMVLHESNKVIDGRREIIYYNPASFKDYFNNNTVISGKQIVPEGTYWYKHKDRRSYESVVFAPEQEIEGAYNLWRGFSYDPDPTGDWSMLEEHIFINIAKGDESLYRWILAWFANIIQTPRQKFGTSLVVRGRQGTGKTILGKAMGALYQPHYALVEDPRYIIGQFNSHMATTLLLHCDEAFFAGDPRNVGKLRGLVTSSTQRIELKGKDSFEVNNYMRLLITSNHDFIVPAALEERRFAVFDAGEGRMQDRAFFKALWHQLKNGGFGRLLYDLQKMDISTIDIGEIPKTSALQDQKLFSLSGVARFWFDRLYTGQLSLVLNGHGSWPEHILFSNLYNDYLKRAKDWGDYHPVDERVFGKEINKLCPEAEIIRKKIMIDVQMENGRTRTEQVGAYFLKSLAEHRQAFAKAMGRERWEDLEPMIEGEDVDKRERYPDEDDSIPF